MRLKRLEDITQHPSSLRLTAGLEAFILDPGLKIQHSKGEPDGEPDSCP